jgi:hypothetical protein
MQTIKCGTTYSLGRKAWPWECAYALHCKVFFRNASSPVFVLQQCTKGYHFHYRPSRHRLTSSYHIHTHSVVELNGDGYWIQRTIHNFRDWCCPLIKKLTLGLLVTIFLEVVLFRRMHRSQRFYHFFKCILVVVFCEWLQRLRFCFYHRSCDK